jgi:hypothetical protein
MLIAACAGDFGHLKEGDPLRDDDAAADAIHDDPDAGGSGGDLTTDGGAGSRSMNAGRGGTGGDLPISGDSTTASDSSAADARREVPIDDGGNDARSLGSPEATLRLAKAICERYAACEPITLQINYGDEATCVVRQQIFQDVIAHLPGMPHSDADRDACSAELEERSCDDFRSDIMKSPCQHITYDPGTLPDGAPCYLSKPVRERFLSAGVRGDLLGEARPRGALRLLPRRPRLRAQQDLCGACSARRKVRRRTPLPTRALLPARQLHALSLRGGNLRSEITEQ